MPPQSVFSGIMRRARGAFKAMAENPPPDSNASGARPFGNQMAEAAQSGRRLGNWRPSISGPNSHASQNGTMRGRVYKAYMDMGLAVKGIDELTSQYIGTGISARPMAQDKTLREDLVGWWEDWVVHSDFYGVQDFYGQQTQICRAWLMGGEGLAQFVREPAPTGGAKAGADLNLRLKLMEVDHIADSSQIASVGNNGATRAQRIVQGVQLDSAGRIEGYWMHPNHPADYAHYINVPVYVPASQILRVFKPDRPGQLRGIPRLHAALVKMHGLDSFDDATLERQRIANMFAAFIKRPPRDNSELTERITAFSQAMKSSGATDAEIQAALGETFAAMQEAQSGLERYAMQPAMMQELGYGEEVQFSNPPGADSNYRDFWAGQVTLLAAAIGMQPFQLTGDYRDLSDRAIRDGILNFRRMAEADINNVMIHQFVRPVRNAFVDALLLSGRIKARDVAQAKKAQFVPDGWHYMHPTQDVQADIMAVKAGFTSRSAVALRRGEDAETVDAARAADQQRERDLSIGPYAPPPPQPAPVGRAA
jgi:lambda family phage portal protein